MAEVQWIKLYIDMFDRRKINKIRRLPEGDKILLFWVMLLATAGKCNAGGMIYITERVPFTKEDLADEFDFEISTIELALRAFVEYDMIDLYDDGFISVRNWEEYQNADKLAEIRAKDRERKRLKKAQARAELPEAPSSTEIPRNIHGNSTDVPHIEEEKEEEREKEEEFHSIIHSAREEDMPSDPEYRRRYLGGIGKNVVFLSDEQMSDLLDKMSIEEFDYYVGVIADNELKGHHYKKKTHYQAILDMAIKDRKVGK